MKKAFLVLSFIGLFALPSKAFCQSGGNTSIIADTDDFEAATKKMLSFCDTAEKDLPLFQTSGVETAKNTVSNGRYLVTASAVRPMVIYATFTDKVKGKKVVMMFAKDEKSLYDRYKIFTAPKDKARELAGYWMAEIYK